jgi:hypothetical protein
MNSNDPRAPGRGPSAVRAHATRNRSDGRRPLCVRCQAAAARASRTLRRRAAMALAGPAATPAAAVTSRSEFTRRAEAAGRAWSKHTDVTRTVCPQTSVQTPRKGSPQEIFCGRFVTRDRSGSGRSVRKFARPLEPRAPIDLVNALRMVAGWLQVGGNLCMGGEGTGSTVVRPPLPFGTDVRRRWTMTCEGNWG